MSLQRVSLGSAEYNRVLEWLYDEAALLDRGEFLAWLELMAPDITYEMPTRQSVYQKDGDGYDQEFGFFAENHSSLETRVKRLQTDQAWAEQPGSRTRHFVPILLLEKADNGEFHATTSFMVTRIRSDLPYDLFTGERRDVLRPDEEGFQLSKRTIMFDQTVLKSYNLSIFL